MGTGRHALPYCSPFAAHFRKLRSGFLTHVVGLGLRDLGKGLYECCHGLDQRIVLQKISSGLYFHLMGDHVEVKRFLKRQK